MHNGLDWKHSVSFSKRSSFDRLALHSFGPRTLTEYRALVQRAMSKGSIRLQRQHHTSRDLYLVTHDDYRVRLSEATDDPAWDAFVAQTHGGHHLQTSGWAQVKALLGWQAVRMVVTQEEHVVAGAQVLIRPLPVGGAIGYVSRGPIAASDEPVLLRRVLGTLHQVARTHRLQYLAVEPPRHAEALVRLLPQWGFRPSSLRILPSATVLLDLTQTTDALLAHMKPKTRYNLRLGERKGIVVREGTERDLGTFYRLLHSTAQRQEFSICSEDYYSRMWRILSPEGCIKLFLAESAGAIVSALLAIPFGDTVTFKRGGWSGDHGNDHPNEVLHWTAILWAKSRGYHYYDFDGVELPVARAVLNGDPDARRSVTAFKLGFSPQVTLFPGTYDYVDNPLLRWTYTTVYPQLAHWPIMAKMRAAVRRT